MRLDRRTFHRLLLLGAAAQAFPLEADLFAGTADWHDLAQPFAAQVRRLLVALAAIGEPLPAAETASLNVILAAPPASDTVARLEALLRPFVLLEININPESRVSVTPPYNRPFLHLERARIGKSRTLPVELVVNGVSHQTLHVEADGALMMSRFAAM